MAQEASDSRLVQSQSKSFQFVVGFHRRYCCMTCIRKSKHCDVPVPQYAGHLVKTLSSDADATWPPDAVDAADRLVAIARIILGR